MVGAAVVGHFVIGKFGTAVDPAFDQHDFFSRESRTFDCGGHLLVVFRAGDDEIQKAFAAFTRHDGFTGITTSQGSASRIESKSRGLFHGPVAAIT
mgnify:CR=1 FL=1